MAPLKHLSLIFFIWSIFIYGTSSQLVVCNGQAGSTCACGPASTPGEICVLDCSRQDMCKEHTLQCRPGDPCYVNCAGANSCSEQTFVNSNGATDLTVRCETEDSCRTAIHIVCGSGDCLLECIRFGSCREFGWVDTRIARSFACHGVFCPWSLLPNPFSPAPTSSPTGTPTQPPTSAPTLAPTSTPTSAPTQPPTSAPTHSTGSPSTTPTDDPTTDPTTDPTKEPTTNPTWNPSFQPTTFPTFNPSTDPTIYPTKSPSDDPSLSPTPSPTNSPTNSPWDNPTVDPTVNPTPAPTDPTESPTVVPTPEPTDTPTADPTLSPTKATYAPSEAPTAYAESAAAAALNTTGWAVLISILSISCLCIICILICCLFFKKYQREKAEAETAMSSIGTPHTQPNITPDTHDTDMQVVDGMVTMGTNNQGQDSISKLDLYVLHSLNAYNKQDKRKMFATNGGKSGEDKDKDLDFQIDPNLISAFMFGGGAGGGTDAFGEAQGGDGGDTQQPNPFGDGFEEETGGDPFDGNIANPFADLYGGDNNPVDGDNDDGNGNEEPIALQQADSVDEMSLLQQRMKLMRLLQQQYELMSQASNAAQAQGQGRGRGRGQGPLHQELESNPEAAYQDDHNVDMGAL